MARKNKKTEVKLEGITFNWNFEHECWEGEITVGESNTFTVLADNDGLHVVFKFYPIVEFFGKVNYGQELAPSVNEVKAVLKCALKTMKNDGFQRSQTLALMAEFNFACEQALKFPEQFAI